MTELYIRAAEQLNDDKLEVRLAAIYVLREIGNDFPDLANPVFELVQAHIRNREPSNESDETPIDMIALMDIVAGRVERR